MTWRLFQPVWNFDTLEPLLNLLLFFGRPLTFCFSRTFPWAFISTLSGENATPSPLLFQALAVFPSFPTPRLLRTVDLPDFLFFGPFCPLICFPIGSPPFRAPLQNYSRWLSLSTCFSGLLGRSKLAEIRLVFCYLCPHERVHSLPASF